MLFWEFSKTLETTIFQDKYSEHLFLCPREDRIKNTDKKEKNKITIYWKVPGRME